MGGVKWEPMPYDIIVDGDGVVLWSKREMADDTREGICMGGVTYKNVADRTFEPGTEIYELPGKTGWLATHPNSMPVFIGPDAATCFVEKVDEVTDGKGQAETKAAS